MSDLVFISDGIPTTTSLLVAETFGKSHAKVMRDIRRLLTQVPEIFLQANFGLASQLQETPLGEKETPYYTMTQDGFTLLVMGYTGAKAMQFKLAYIEAFNAMRDALGKSTTPTLTLSTAAERKPLRYIVHTWAQTSGQSHATCWSMVKAAFQLTRIDDLPVAWIPDAIAWVQEKIDALQAKALPQPNAPAVRRDQKELEAFFDKYFVAIRDFNDTLASLEKEYAAMTADIVKNAVLRMQSDRNAPFFTDDLITCIHSQHSEALKRFRDGGDLLWRSRQTICCLNQM
jgi:Rha family phage regulatory protein